MFTQPYLNAEVCLGEFRRVLSPKCLHQSVIIIIIIVIIIIIIIIVIIIIIIIWVNRLLLFITTKIQKC